MTLERPYAEIKEYRDGDLSIKELKSILNKIRTISYK